MATTEELEALIHEMQTTISTLKRRTDELEDFAQTHIGLDWGASGISANTSHPNISADSIESGGGKARFDLRGIQINSEQVGSNYDPSIYFQHELVSDPSSETRRALIRGHKAGNTDGTSLFISMIVTDGDGDNAVVNVNNSTDGQPKVNLESTESGVRTTYLTVEGYREYVSIGGMLFLDGNYSADPNPTPGLSDGSIWYRVDTDKFRGRANGATKNFLLEGDASGAMKVSGSGYEVYPSAAAGVDPANSGSAWTNAAYSEIVASTAEAVYIVGLTWDEEDGNYEYEIDLATGAAASETVVSTFSSSTGTGAAGMAGGKSFMFPHAIAVATTTRIACRVRSSSTTLEPDNVKVIYIDQDSLVAL